MRLPYPFGRCASIQVLTSFMTPSLPMSFSRSCSSARTSAATVIAGWTSCAVSGSLFSASTAFGSRLKFCGVSAAAGRRRAAADGPHRSAPSSAAEELIATIGFEPGHDHAGRHLDALEDLSRSRIDATHVAFVPLPRAMPELSINPGHAGHEPVGLDRSKNRPCLGIDLMDLPVPILSHPERAFGPGEPRVTPAARCRNRGDDAARARIDLLNAILGELKQVLAIECRSGMPRDIERAPHFPTHRIERLQGFSRGKPYVLTIIGDAMHVVDAWKGPILANDLGGSGSCFPHRSTILNRAEARGVTKWS